MTDFSSRNPVALLIYFLCVVSAAMFCSDPVLLSLSVAGALSLSLTKSGARSKSLYLAGLCIFLLISVLNPLFSHNGMTVLFVMNDNPVTLEALYYGITAGAAVTAVMYWFFSFSKIMTSDKLLYIFGSISPKFSLIFSMALRYIPLFKAQIKKTNDAQKALGLYKDEKITDRLSGGLRTFSIIVTWAIENGITTADSMEARGYNTGSRTSFAVFHFRRSDALLIAASLALISLVFLGIGTDSIGYTFYPSVSVPETTVLSTAAYAAYGLLSAVPIIIETEETLRWKYLRSKI